MPQLVNEHENHDGKQDPADIRQEIQDRIHGARG